MKEFLTGLKSKLVAALGALFPIGDRELNVKYVYQTLKLNGWSLVKLRAECENRLMLKMQEINPDFELGKTAFDLFRQVATNSITYDNMSKGLEATLLDTRAPHKTLAWILLSFNDVTVEEFSDLIKIAEHLDNTDVAQNTYATKSFRCSMGFDYIDSPMWSNIHNRCIALGGVV